MILLNVFRDIDKVDDLMQDITDQQELAQEISDAISRPVGFGEDFDEVRFFLCSLQCSPTPTECFRNLKNKTKNIDSK